MASSESQEGMNETLDLTRKGLKKLDRLAPGSPPFVTLVVDDNELQRLENLDTYASILKLSAANNRIVRMLGVQRLHQLQVLNLPKNCINCIEGLKDLVHLTWLNLSDNNIKNIQYLTSNVRLEYLDLSQNAIGHISDVSHLKSLKKLMLHGNKISTLKFCNIYLPSSLVTLTLSHNEICDLTELFFLSHLTQLEHFSIAGNPAVIMTGQAVGFDYRPYVINWCLSLRMLDGFIVGPKDSLKAEWLYSQGKGRHFRPGEHEAVVQYLATVCPLCPAEDSNQGNEEDEKLMRILSKAKEHQTKLREEQAKQGSEEEEEKPSRPTSAAVSTSALSTSRMTCEAKLSPMLRRQIARRKGFTPSPRPLSSRSNSSCEASGAYNVELPPTLYGGDGIASGAASASDMTRSMDADSLSSHHLDDIGLDSDLNSSTSSLMSQSLDPEMLRASVTGQEERVTNGALFQSVPVASRSKPGDLVMQDISDEGISTCIALEAATKFVPVPEAMMSPDFCPVAARSNRFPPANSATKDAGQQNGIPKCRAGQGSGEGAGNGQPQPAKASRNDLIFGGFIAASRSPLVARKRSADANVEMSRSIPPPTAGPAASLASSSRHCGTRICGKPIVAVETRRINTAPASCSPTLRPRGIGAPLTGTTPSASPLPSRRRPPAPPPQDTGSPDIGDAIFNQKLESIRRIAEERKLTLEGKAVAAAAREATARAAKSESPPPPAEPAPEVRRKANEAKAATVIQKCWRGYQTRRLNPRVVKILEDLRYSRAESYIRHLMKELEHIKGELDNERKLRKLQMEAIRAIWKEKMSEPPMPTPSTSGPSDSGERERDREREKEREKEQAAVSELSRTCAILQTQVQQLQGSFEHILGCMAQFTSQCPSPAPPSSHTLPVPNPQQYLERCSAAIQTMITAVQTPKDEHFPFSVPPSDGAMDTLQVRPKSLALSSRSRSKSSQQRQEEAPEEVRQYVTDMVEEILTDITSRRSQTPPSSLEATPSTVVEDAAEESGTAGEVNEEPSHEASMPE